MELMEKRRKHFAALRAQEKRNRPPTKAQKRSQMSTYLKHMGGYKHKQLMGKSYEEIQKLFDKEMKRVNTFVAMTKELKIYSLGSTSGIRACCEALNKKEHPTNFALMAYTSSGSSSSSDTEVDSCSKSCVKAYATLKEQYDSLCSDYKKSQFNLVSYKAGLQSVEDRLVHYKKNEVVFEESINVLKLEVRLRDNALDEYKMKLEKAKKERDQLKQTLEKFQNSSKSLNDLLESQVMDKFKTRLGHNAATPAVESFVNLSDKSGSDKGYHSIPPPLTRNFILLNRTLIEAARTMLVDSKLPTTFWAEAVNTALRNQTNGIVGKRDNIVAGQAEKKIEPEQDINSINTVSTPVSTVGPSCTNDDLSSPVNAAEASNAFEGYLFERFSPFRNAFTLPLVQHVNVMNDTKNFC
ncbi:hypothetical protein Tco_1449430 [Tanacetum coccineum]